MELDRHGTAAQEIEQHLRGLDPPVIARIQDGHVVLDLRTVLPEQDGQIGDLIFEVLRMCSCTWH